MTICFMLVGLFSWVSVAMAEVDPSTEEVPQENYPLSGVLLPILTDLNVGSGDIGIHVVNVRTKEEVFAYNADHLLIPASIMKAVTSAVALRELGPDFRFYTKIYATGGVTNAGVVKGDLYIKGSGDPSLFAQDLWQIVHDLKQKGIRKIDGNVYYDNSLFDGVSFIPGWKKRDERSGPSYFPMISALSVNYNNFAIKVRPGQKMGEPAHVFTEFPTRFISINNQVTTGGAKSRPEMTLRRSTDKSKYVFHLKGRIPVDETDPWSYKKAVPHPDQYFMSIFSKMLKSHGIRVKGKHKLKTLSSRAKLLHFHRSPHLRSMIAEMNKRSQNLIAEQLLLQIGVQENDGPAQTEDGLKVVRNYLASLGVYDKDIVLTNGSGLSAKMKLRSSTITAVLIDMYEQRTIAPEYFSSLAVGGGYGTLRHRLKDKKYFSRVRGKTGTLAGTYCIAAYVWAGDGEIYAVSFIANNVKRSARVIRKLQDKMIRFLLEMKSTQQ